MASEMLYPVMPVYLKSIGYSVVVIGVLEGFAEAVAGMGKSYFGRLSDVTGKRLPFVQMGYFLSALSKPMLALSTQLWWIFLARFTDRAGKGLRTAPRDAMLSIATQEKSKATVFGFHRMMDTIGAVIGPLIALLFFYFYPGEYKIFFLLAFIPGLAAVALTFFLRENKTALSKKKTIPFDHTLVYWKQAPGIYRKLVAGLLLFALFNSSDVFLLLKMKDAGLADTGVIAVYIFYNLVYALFALPLGRLADRVGMKSILLLGLVFFILTYTGFSLNTQLLLFWPLLCCYGIYAAATESVAKAWISNLVPVNQTASAIGLYTGLQSLAALLASSLAGFIWHHYQPEAVFLSAAIAATLAAVWIHFRVPVKINFKLGD